MFVNNISDDSVTWTVWKRAFFFHFLDLLSELICVCSILIGVRTGNAHFHSKRTKFINTVTASLQNRMICAIDTDRNTHRTVLRMAERNQCRILFEMRKHEDRNSPLCLAIVEVDLWVTTWYEETVCLCALEPSRQWSFSRLRVSHFTLYFLGYLFPTKRRCFQRSSIAVTNNPDNYSEGSFVVWSLSLREGEQQKYLNSCSPIQIKSKPKI